MNQVALCIAWCAASFASCSGLYAQHMTTMNHTVDISDDFHSAQNIYFVAQRLDTFDPASGSGTLRWNRYEVTAGTAFNTTTYSLRRAMGNEFPSEEYEVDPVTAFSISCVTPRTVRLRISTRRTEGQSDAGSLMLLEDPAGGMRWKHVRTDSSVTYKSEFGSITIFLDPWRVEFRDAGGRLLTRSIRMGDSHALQNSNPLPFSFIRRNRDHSISIAASFSLSYDEKLFGCGESFTRLNKRGQKIPLWTTDAMSAQTNDMYKPIPFFMSSRSYGMFLHASTPMTFDMGYTNDGANTLFLGDDALDLFFFYGTPKEVLSEYTALTGRSPVPPLWSFGLWMSRITYKSEKEVREVAVHLRRERIPCDVIHLDTGWFEKDWRCDYRFSATRFEDAHRMIQDLRQDGFRVSVWQLPYFVPKNRLFKEIMEKKLAVRDRKGNLPTEDAILDFSNPEAVKWYQSYIAGLLKTGVGAIKVDFGEAAPLEGVFHSGMTGFYEHNLYPLRYNKAAADITREVTGESIIWARSAWAGSQRYPVHWGGDAENTDASMAATLRAGLSLGLCGFSFWSHDIGGFVDPPIEELYRRWMPFGMLSSHSRCHGAPPKEPWAFSRKFLNDFREAVELKYKLMPYIYAQAVRSSRQGFPMLRTLFFEYPDDPTSWLIEDEYLFGSELLVAPLFETGNSSREVYCPPGRWVDYQTGKVYEGMRWHAIESGPIPVVMLVRSGSIIPRVKTALSTSRIDWENIELAVFPGDQSTARGWFSLPGEEKAYALIAKRKDGKMIVEKSHLPGGISWNIHRR